MADKKISALTASTTPLAGTEVLPIVQSGTTVKVSVANLTAGRAVSASSVSATNLAANTTAGTYTLLAQSTNAASGLDRTIVRRTGDQTNFYRTSIVYNDSASSSGPFGAYSGGIYHEHGGGFGPSAGLVLATNSSDAGPVILAPANTQRLTVDTSGNLTCLGVYNATVGATNRDVFVDNNGLIGYVSSTRASKTNIVDLPSTEWIYDLRPVSFNYRKRDDAGNYTDEAAAPTEYGLIAEEVETVNADLVFYDETENGLRLSGVSYSKLIIPLLKEIQSLRARVAKLES